MNKQELIDKLASLVGSIEDFKGISTFHDGKYAGLEHALELIKQLDEPQKPFVPKFVADYIEEYRGGGATLYEMMDSSEDEVYTWLFGNPRIKTENERQLLFAQAYAVGYEVEKEPLYEVIIGNLFLVKKFNNRNDSCFVNKFELCWWEKSAYQLTEPEIKAIDERYWPFAVPVEEVAEG
ncbi:TPA: DUF1642 domain-containing protein [Enterococcus faecium]|uniref:DUF1642 domain-containing protein n=1 Tax=Enterococcus faecium TaxID=1352 RepID=UPI001C16ECCE|nr:DUF1642 domain-containing protein [Enterococcus faecium]MCZ1801128.1 DUF1642 domain-containing protein [Enterococcus faecium]MDT0283964.1 DUF1642 domain-containing protein [Enterococcus faecium]MDT0292826.1 DUF1642 domain-containing protein [Enterococcus faecium]MDT0370384.1 DUF1642 domain-containing protein [Enterococcus faecium]MDT0376614.1 DUF1642 domain-containing protein [Enterococcus faecium]